MCRFVENEKNIPTRTQTATFVMSLLNPTGIRPIKILVAHPTLRPDDHRWGVRVKFNNNSIALDATLTLALRLTTWNSTAMTLRTA